ncbi:MAG: type II toxin-antitoxin system VapC family toxin [Thermoanaerobacteraceae bacterium]|nr:type II toxin-antitoxin system VapC family toxin [Thermoanaerobacteraceae bacterium]
MKKVLDAYAVLCWMQDEPGASYVDRLMGEAEEGRVELAISAVNLGEVYYRLFRSRGETEAEDFRADVAAGVFPWRVFPASNRRVWQAAALKGAFRLSYGDAFAVALAGELGAELVTGDPEILAAAPEGGFSVDPIPRE